MWKTLIFLYMADQKQPLPTREEVLICTSDTSLEEVDSSDLILPIQIKFLGYITVASCN